MADNKLNAFAVLAKRKALESISDNVRPTKKAATKETNSIPKQLTQMQLSLGQKVQVQCKECGMDYVPSLAVDRKWHNIYHKHIVDGYDVESSFVQGHTKNVVYDVEGATDRIFYVDHTARSVQKRKAEDVLMVVQKELGAVPIPRKDLWSSQSIDPLQPPEYAAYMYIRGHRCIGFLLTQHISHAKRVLEPGPARKATEQPPSLEPAEQPLRISLQSFPAKLGISRIWTLASARKEGIALQLLDTALKHQNRRAERVRHELHVEKQDVAFSQPTEAGTRLARRWFGEAYGWKIYVD
ncbi:hypothetical protein BAUCODRAFT_63120 [Baudoinia panamericana UAMH 10762]|uniref:N-acetyltransferase ECO1 n=1 Tax=Baudoinia panamericana (strain UAMH 10762) TaxID=717646 RepID=M2MTL8_BAUPA|nr:uncharacterized protein BAUCODRAFT_63120 [Baudoinia panamericana UAMH 10762]EMD00257.1 hypothetical protein BAUCODRAFT_63120 [Baudoinia panamericana UAMH 10762]